MADERRIKLAVYVNLDDFPGVFHTPESARTAVESLLRNSIQHYNPAVYIDYFRTSNGAKENKNVRMQA